jgi:WD40 repeat protein
VAIWRLPTGRLVGPPLDLGDQSAALAFSRDGAQLAVGRMDDGRVTILDPATQRVKRTLRTDNSGSLSLAFAPDGTLAVGSWDGLVRLWQPSSSRPIGRPVLVAAGPVASLSFAADGRRFATTGGADGTTKLWYTTTLQQQGTTLGQEIGWGNAAFTPDGRELIVVHDNGLGAIWPVSADAWQQHACRVAGRNLTHEEWARFVTGRAYRRTCP